MRGEMACTANCLRTRRTAPKTPPAKKQSWAGSRMRVSRVQRAALAAGESAEPPADVPGSGKLGEHDGCAEDEQHSGEDDGHGSLAFVVAPLRRDSG